MACDECRDLGTHAFRSSADLAHALQVAAQELDRGALEQVRASDRSIPEQVALRSALFAGALPDEVLYLFRCTVCGDCFELSADTEHGGGGWKRNDEAYPPEKTRR
jgi:hypothetical protein